MSRDVFMNTMIWVFCDYKVRIQEQTPKLYVFEKKRKKNKKIQKKSNYMIEKCWPFYIFGGTSLTI